MRKRAMKTISYLRAIDRMRGGARLIKLHTGNGFARYVVPGGEVTTVTAEKIKEHPLVRGGKDGLFPGHDQTWMICLREGRDEAA